MEVMAEQTEPMLTLTTDDDINWTVVTPIIQPGALPPPTTLPKETAVTKPVGKYKF